MKREIQKFAASGRFRIRDGDGVPDGAEILQGSDPADATDGGAPNSRTLLGFYFGDHSGSHSEKYRLNVVPVSGHGDAPRTQFRVNACYGQCETNSVILKPGWSYSVTLEHAGTKYGEETDYDYTLTLSQPVPSNVIVDDPDGLFGVDDTSSSFAAAGKEAMLYVLGRPRLVPDYDRNGEIDENDIADAATNRVFRFWINDDEDARSLESGISDSPRDDIPGADTGLWEMDFRDPDCADGKVNGLRDLIDFTPIGIDLTEVISPLSVDVFDRMRFLLRQGDAALNAVWTSLAWSEAGRFQVAPFHECGDFLNEDASCASNCRLTAAGTELPAAFLGHMVYEDSKGLMLVEGCAATTNEICIEIWYGNSLCVSNSIPVRISGVEDMFRWLNVRALSGETETWPSRTGEPANGQYSASSSRHLVFVHGANVTEKGSRGWAAEVFKRMWQSGMTAKFTGVSWRSDIGSDMNYQENVSNAFFTASVLAQMIDDLPGEKVLMAHSLGNMVCSSMIQDYNLEPECYLMCNSAVPAEAYDADVALRVPQLVHPEWEEYPTNSWASSWHSLFMDDVNDDRRHLGWPGRFASVAQYAVNFYSSGDEVLELVDDNDISVFTGISSSLAHHSWHKQELFKGRGTGVGFGATDWSGWSIRRDFYGQEIVPVSNVLEMANADLRTNTVFYCYPASMNQPVIPLLTQGAHLGLGIPALTPATGVVVFDSWNYGSNYNLNQNAENQGIARPNEWPVRSNYTNQWCHSDIKDVAFFFNFKFYEKVMQKGDLKCQD